jgi:hypothetical protein
MKIAMYWMKRQANISNYDGLATDAMWKATNVWPRVHLMSCIGWWVCIMYILLYLLLTTLTTPGIPHFATKGEVFDNPSWVVHAFLGLYEWELKTKDIW